MKKILIVEDDPRFQMTVAYSILSALHGFDDVDREMRKKIRIGLDPSPEFKKLGYDLKITAFASEGKDLLIENNFAMISLDGRIFNGHGNELLQLIPKKDHAQKVLLFSGSLSDFEENSANKVGKGGWNTRESLISVSKQILNL